MLQDRDQNEAEELQEYQKLMSQIRLSDDFKARTALKMKEAGTQKPMIKGIRRQKILAVAASAVLVVGIGAVGYFNLSDMNYDIIDGITTFSGYQNPKKPFVHPPMKESASESQQTANPPAVQDSSNIPSQYAAELPSDQNQALQDQSDYSEADAAVSEPNPSSSSQETAQSEPEQNTASTTIPPATPRKIEEPEVQQQQSPTDMLNNPPGVNKANADLVWSEICTVESEAIVRQKSAVQRNQYYQESLNQIDDDLISYVGEEAYQEWYRQFQKEVDGEMQDKYRFSQPYMSDGTANYAALENSLWGFIQHFQIPKEEFIRLYQPTRDKTRESLNVLHYPKEAYQKYNCRITDQQVDALYSDDPSQVMVAFAGYDAVYADGQMYSYTWFDKHLAEDYIAAGFTSAQLEEIIADMSNQETSYLNEQGKTVLIYDLDLIKNETARMKELETAAKEKNVKKQNSDKATSSEKSKEKTK